MGTRAWPGCSPNFSISLRRGSHCYFSFDSSAIGTSMDPSFHSEFSTLKPCSPFSRRRKEEEEILKDEWETTQILAEMAYPGTTDTGISPVWGFCSVNGLSGFFASTLPLFPLHRPVLLRKKVIPALTLLQQHSLVSPSSLCSANLLSGSAWRWKKTHGCSVML